MKHLIAILILWTLPLGAEPEASLVRVNSTIQKYNVSQPWEKTTPRKRRGLGCLLPGKRVLTTASIAADAVYLELESADSSRTVSAKVVAIDHEANLALLAPENGSGFLDELQGAELAEPIALGDSLRIFQLEDNGMALETAGRVQGMELLSSMSPGSYFLSYVVKASMQSAASSYTLPAFREGKLVGILTSYDAKDQICE
ncbi:MAG: hypothetical protein ACQKBY_06540, partial [Verrucomicrobiales bacterium]